ncbi:alpha/beta-hydrolase [Polyplosphaeria fusca]|uniref:Alpha/beta-hydrolase n=1 Tax=Polyplosphaeria fusca TaxID=682080 RepID=A0A9P4QQA3_9PLEO|nr:alpha/beta-hydrolase [Polyplosphaeria fusca]
MIAAAKILEQRTHVVPGKLKVTEHFFQVPRDHSNPSHGTIQLFARSVLKSDSSLDAPDPKKSQLPWLLYLQGGPGYECRSPQATAWTTPLLDKGYRVLFLDQRGTGLSNAVSQSSLQLRGNEDVQTAYMKSFRADSIVRDCEAVRQALVADYPDEKKKWSICGQSFGGFCVTTYLSLFPEALKEAFVFGGLPPMRNRPDEVYDRLYARVKRRNDAYYAKFPEDVERVRRVVKLLRRFGDETVRVQGGEGFLPARRFLQLGLQFGFLGGLDAVHDIVLRADADLAQHGHLSKPTVMAIEGMQSFDSNVIYALLHEPCYCQGEAPNWAAERMMQKHPEFKLEEALKTDAPILFTGEMVYPFMLDSYPELRKLKTVAENLAQTKDWPKLYDDEQLSRNEVPVYAAVYYDDMYVDFDLSMERARNIKGCKTFITNAMSHEAIRSKTEEVFKAIWALRDDTLD